MRFTHSPYWHSYIRYTHPPKPHSRVRFTHSPYWHSYIRYTHPPKPHSRPGHGTNVTPPTRVRTSSSSGSRTRDSGAGGGRSNKERQRLQPLASVARAPLFEVSRVRFTHSPYWHSYIRYTTVKRDPSKTVSRCDVTDVV